MDGGIGVEDVARAFSQFGLRDVSRGRRYFAQRRVSRLERSIEADGMILYTASVRGSTSMPYTTYLVFESRTRRLVSAECTCPLSGDCKHCVATLEALERAVADRRETVPGATSGGRGNYTAEPAKVARATITPPVVRPDAAERWVRMLEHLSSADELLLRRSAAPAKRERLVFVLSPLHEDVDPLGLKVGVFREEIHDDGTPGDRRILGTNIDWAHDAAVSPGDHALFIKLGALSMGYASLIGELGGRLFQDLVATGRALFDRGAPHPPLLLSTGGAKAGALTFVDDEEGGQVPSVSVSGVDHARVLLLLPPSYIDTATGAAGPIDVKGASGALVYTWLTGARIEPDAAASAARHLAAARLPFRPPTPRVRTVRRVDVPPTLVLRLESHKATNGLNGGVERPWARVFFDYGGQRVDPSAPVLERVDGDSIVRISRRPSDEWKLLGKLEGAGLVHGAATGREVRTGMTMGLPHKVSPFLLAPRVQALASAGVRVETAPDYAFGAVVADDVLVALNDAPGSSAPLGADFAMSLGIHIGGEIVDALPVVLAALRERVPGGEESLLVTLHDGRTVIIPSARLTPLRRLLIELLGEREPGRITRARALALDPAVIARSPESLERLRAALASPRRVPVPRSLRATLRDYQREGFEWLMARRQAHLGAVLADDMGLGKTIQALAMILAEKREGVPSLVVCPKSVLGNWESETARFAPSLCVHVHHGRERAMRVPGFDKADLVLTTYPLLARDTEIFASLRFATVVLDEAQTIKSAGSTYTQAACALRADFRLALSGTPMENHLGELWSVFRFTLPELLGESRSFGRLFRRPIEVEGDPAAGGELSARLATFLLRRRKDAVASELPPKTVVIERVPLDDAQRDVYETVRAAMDVRVRDALARQGLAKSHIVVLDALLKLRQAVCDPRLLKVKAAKTAGSAKLTVLIEKLSQLVEEGRRVLVFSQFVTMLNLVQAALVRERIPYLLLTGQTENRAEVVDAFQRGEAPVFLLSLKSGGTGLNLTAADVVIHYDPWWNPAAEDQATDRAHRIGQDKPVLVYKLVGKDTIEEKILALQEKKKALFATVMDEGAGVAKALTASDVAFLFAR